MKNNGRTATKSDEVKASTRHSKIAAVIPAYNEERFIGDVIQMAQSQADVVIVIDDGSVDATAKIAKEHNAIVASHPINFGKGEALNTGFRLARELGVDVMVVLDGDGQHNPSEIPLLAKPILEKQADIVIGSRFLEIRNRIPKWRTIGQHTLTWATNLSSGINVSDSQSGFRAFSSRAVQLISFGQNGFSVESEMQFLANRYNLKVVEVPITCSYDESSKRNPVLHGLQVMDGLLALIGQHRPLLFFGVLGLIFMALGLLWGWWVTATYYDKLVLPVGQALITVMLCVIGTLSLFTGIILHSIRALILELKNSLITMSNNG